LERQAVIASTREDGVVEEPKQEAAGVPVNGDAE
jgi:hypothetical protein